MNPLTPNLTGLTDDELNTKVNDIYRRMRQVMNNPPLFNQLSSIMQDYQNEQQRRAFDRQKEFLDSELAKRIDIQ